jgi:RNA polymerase sigma-70 factor (ECF subfamily)
MESDTAVWRERGLRDAVLAGDRSAWQVWYDESFAGLDAYVLWRCGGRRDRADEVLQETWLIAVRRVRDFDPARARFRTWLAGIAANVLREHHRRHRRSANGHLIGDVAAGDDSAVRERQERVEAALATLPERYEQALRAKYLDRLGVAEIAAANGETVKTVESLLTRARQAFRDAYGPEE